MKTGYAMLASYIRSMEREGMLILSRSDDEIRFLKEWLNRGGGEHTPGGAASLDAVRNGIRECAKCSSSHSKKFGYGTGENRIMIVLNNPQMIALNEREMLRSESVELLKKMMQSIQVDFDRCYITNLIKCETYDYFSSPSTMFNNCEGMLSQEISAVKPGIVIVMGEILPLRSIIREQEGISWYNIEHPLVLLKNPDLKRTAWNTLKIVMARIKELSGE